MYKQVSLRPYKVQLTEVSDKTYNDHGGGILFIQIFFNKHHICKLKFENCYEEKILTQTNLPLIVVGGQPSRGMPDEAMPSGVKVIGRRTSKCATLGGQAYLEP